MAVTVYNSNFGLVRERRRVALAKGRVELSYADVAAQLSPESVHLRSLGEPEALTVYEQNYRYDLLTPETLLKKYVGKTLRVVRYNETLGREEEKTAEVLATESGPVLRIDGEVTYGVPGRLAFPKLPENLVERPTLVWLLGSTEPQQELEVSYLTQGLNWAADYVLLLSADDTRADLTGWVSLTNESGATFENAELKLVAGDVQRLSQPQSETSAVAYDRVANQAAPQFQQENLFEYHLYSLDRPTTLRDKEKKQVSLLAARGVPVTKRLVLQGSDYYFRPMIHPPVQNQKVRVLLEWQNDAKSQLGAPLPKGVIRVYKSAQDGSSQFVGEDRIEHTPRDEKVSVTLGDAFDVVADRKELSNTPLSPCVVESEWRVELRNHKDASEVVEVRESTAGDFEIISSSAPVQRKEARLFVFSLPVQARSKAELGFKVRVRYCADSPKIPVTGVAK